MTLAVCMWGMEAQEACIAYSDVYNTDAFAAAHSFDLSLSAENVVVFACPPFSHQTTVTVVSSR